MVNDISIITGIVAFFIFLGVLLPFVQAEFGETAATTDVQGYVEDLNSDDAGSSVSAFKVLGSVASMFFWSFGAIWWPIDLLLFVPLRVVLLITVARNVWIGGGG